MTLWLRRLVGTIALLIGAGTVVLTLATLIQILLVSAMSDRQTQSGTWSWGTLHIEVIDEVALCDIRPQRGTQRSIIVPRERHYGRGSSWTGVMVSRWFDGSADVVCDNPVLMTRQPLPMGFWLVKHNWLIIVGAVVGGLGWYLLPEPESSRLEAIFRNLRRRFGRGRR